MLDTVISGKLSRVLALAPLVLTAGCALLDPTPRAAGGWQGSTGPVPTRPARAGGRPSSSGSLPPTAEHATLHGARSVTGAGQVHVRMLAPDEVQVGVPFEHILVVTNTGAGDLRDVTVTERLSRRFAAERSSPAHSSTDGDVLTWNLSTLPAGSSVSIRVLGSVLEPGKLDHCVEVASRTGLCAEMKAGKPLLTLLQTVGDRHFICDQIPIRLEVKNEGDVSAHGTKLAGLLGEGLALADGQREWEFPIDSLAPGTSRRFTVAARALRTGQHTSSARLSATGTAPVTDTATLQVGKPVLKLVKTGDEKQLLGRPLSARLKLSNTGDAPALNVVVRDSLPVGATAAKVSAGGEVREGTIEWRLPALPAGKEASFAYVLRTDKTGDFINRATASAVCADAASATQRVTVNGIPAILLEVIDVRDPVEVGQTATYVIVATNQGSATGTNITIACEVEDTQSILDATGETAASVDGRKVTFAPLPALAPKEKATWRVDVKALRAGDVRFKARMTSDQLGRPVTETEATQLY